MRPSNKDEVRHHRPRRPDKRQQIPRTIACATSFLARNFPTGLPRGKQSNVNPQHPNLDEPLRSIFEHSRKLAAKPSQDLANISPSLFLLRNFRLQEK